MQRQGNSMTDDGQPKTIIPHFTFTLCSLELFFRWIQTNFLNYQIVSQNKKGRLNSEITSQIFTTLLLDVGLSPRNTEQSNDSEEQGGRASTNTLVFLVMLTWQKIDSIGRTKNTEHLPRMHLHTFPLVPFTSNHELCNCIKGKKWGWVNWEQLAKTACFLKI